MSKLAAYWKGIVAGAGAVAVVVQATLTDGSVSDAEKLTIAIAVLTAIGVFLKANETPA